MSNTLNTLPGGLLVRPPTMDDAQNLTGATRLYERAGMHIARQYIGYEKELRTGVELSTQALEE